MRARPERCIDPIMKYCQGCDWGWIKYHDWVETAADLEGCTFESGCMLGYDTGRPEDEPTEEEVAEFNKWLAEYFPDHIQTKEGG